MARSGIKVASQRVEEPGHQFRTNSDTETMVHAYEEYGVDCVARLHGMFGFALWEAVKDGCCWHEIALERNHSTTP